MANQTLSVTYIYKLREIPEKPEEISDIPKTRDDFTLETKAVSPKPLDKSYAKEKLPKTGERPTSSIVSIAGSGILLALYYIIRRN
ncbi:MAG TPA: hypothetical protein DCR07_06430 [Lactococcus sp.]|nr:hypothetical protein [Lactococcus sp.]